MRKIIRNITLVVFGLIVVAYVVVENINVDSYRPYIEEQVEHALKRDVTLGGPISLSLFSLHPSLQVRQVTVKNPDWSQSQDMLHVDRLDLQLAIAPLLQGDLVVESLMLRDVDVNLEVDSKGKKSWLLGQSSVDNGQDKAAEKKVEDVDDGLGLRLLIRTLEVKDLRLNYYDQTNQVDHKMVLERLLIDGGGQGITVLSGEGVYNDEEFVVRLKTQALDTLSLASGIPFNGTLSFLGMEARLMINLDAGGMTYDVQASGSDLARIGRALNVHMPAKDYEMTLKGKGSSAGYSLDSLKLRLGSSALAGNGRIILGDKPTISAAIVADTIDLSDFILAEEAMIDHLNDSSSISAWADEVQRLFSTDPLPLASLRRFDASIGFKARQIKTNTLQVSGADAELNLRNGQLVATIHSLTVFDGLLTGTLSVNGAKEPGQLGLKAQGQDIKVGQLLTSLKGINDVSGKGRFQIDLKGQGKSVAGWMGSLHGTSVIIIEDGHIDQKFFSFASGSFADLMTPWTKGKDSGTLECAVSRFAVTKGIARSKTLFVKMPNLDIIGSGHVNLGKETISMRITPDSVDASLLSIAPPVIVQGSLADPSITPDLSGKVFKSVKDIVSVPTDVVQGVVGLLGGEKDDGVKMNCAMAISGKEPARAAPKTRRSSKIKDEKPPVADLLNKGVEGISEGLGKLFD